MNISPSSQINFKGYSARPMKGFLMSHNYFGLAKEMSGICKKEGFELLISDNFCTGKNPTEMIPSYRICDKELWIQDNCSLLKDMIKVKINFPEFQNLAKYFSKKLDHSACRIAGGNMFFIEDGDKEILLVGADDLKFYTPERIKQVYNVETLIPVPQMDYHLDLFIRPLKGKDILIADDRETMRVLREGKEKLLAKLEKEPNNLTLQKILANIDKLIVDMQNAISLNTNPRVRRVKELLEEKGFNMISVPGRIYSSDQFHNNKQLLMHSCNYINANAALNPDGELVYITNKSDVDEKLGITDEVVKEIGFSFEKSFIDSISSYVKPEHIYFVKGENDFVKNEMLQIYMGGIHCACAEIPYTK